MANKMTLNDIACQYGKSVRTLYRRIQKSGLRLDDLRDADGSFSEDAAAQIASLLDKSDMSIMSIVDAGDGMTRQIDKVTHIRETEELRKALADAEAKTAAAETEVQRLSERVDDMRRQLDEMARTLEDTRADRDRWYQVANQAQQLQLQQMKLLPERATISQRVRGWFNRNRKQEG